MEKAQSGEPRRVSSALLPGAALPDLIFQDTATSFMGPTMVSLQLSLIQSTKGRSRVSKSLGKVWKALAVPPGTKHRLERHFQHHLQHRFQHHLQHHLQHHFHSFGGLIAALNCISGGGIRPKGFCKGKLDQQDEFPTEL